MLRVFGLTKSTRTVPSVVRTAGRNLVWRSGNAKMSSWAPLLANPKIRALVDEMATLCKPEKVHVCDGSDAENKALLTSLVAAGAIETVPKRPGCYLARTDPGDVARVVDRTFICSEKESDSGPTNKHQEPTQMMAKLRGLFDSVMTGRTMYVIPYSMGPVGSPLARYGVQITDSAFVVANMRIMTRIGADVLEAIGTDEKSMWIPSLHTVGAPLAPGQKDVAWPCNKEKYICHFPDMPVPEIWSYGSGYGGNSLLGKKCFALRIASVLAKRQGWLAEHMLILGITNPAGVKKYIAAAFPSACGKTNLAMMVPRLEGWKIECVGDDIAWMTVNEETGQLHAINPENGFFGVAPGTSTRSNPNAMTNIEKDTLFTNVARTQDGDVWWKDMTKTPPKDLIDWHGNIWNPETDPEKAKSQPPAAHPNSRFTTPLANCPIVDDRVNDPKGVPISAIIFGGRRPSLVPLVHEAFDWDHGVFMGTAISSEETAAQARTKTADGKPPIVHDPFAMGPFCGYNMSDYFKHWLSFGPKVGKNTKIYTVNWFRNGPGGANDFLWPGFGDNSRVLEWVFNRSTGEASAVDTPIGRMPVPGAINTSGLSPVPPMDELLAVDKAGWRAEVAQLKEYYATKFGDELPSEITAQLNALEQRLNQ